MMPWVRFDDMFTVHRKVDGLSDTAFRLHVSAIFWCARNLTDGAVPEEDLDLVTARVRAPARFAAELVRRGLWHETGTGWVIHDYLEFQPTKDKIQRERVAKAERQARWLAKRNGHKSRDASLDASLDASADATPPRPAPKEGGSGAPAASAARRSAARRSGGEQKKQKPSTPVIPGKCHLHLGQPAANCRVCRSERIAAEAS